MKTSDFYDDLPQESHRPGSPGRPFRVQTDGIG